MNKEFQWPLQPMKCKKLNWLKWEKKVKFLSSIPINFCLLIICLFCALYQIAFLLELVSWFIEIKCFILFFCSPFSLCLSAPFLRTMKTLRMKTRMRTMRKARKRARTTTRAKRRTTTQDPISRKKTLSHLHNLDYYILFCFSYFNDFISIFQWWIQCQENAHCCQIKRSYCQ